MCMLLQSYASIICSPYNYVDVVFVLDLPKTFQNSRPQQNGDIRYPANGSPYAHNKLSITRCPSLMHLNECIGHTSRSGPRAIRGFTTSSIRPVSCARGSRDMAHTIHLHPEVVIQCSHVGTAGTDQLNMSRSHRYGRAQYVPVPPVRTDSICPGAAGTDGANMSRCCRYGRDQYVPVTPVWTGSICTGAAGKDGLNVSRCPHGRPCPVPCQVLSRIRAHGYDGPKNVTSGTSQR